MTTSAFGIEHDDVSKGLPSALRNGKSATKYGKMRIKAHQRGGEASAELARMKAPDQKFGQRIGHFAAADILANGGRQAKRVSDRAARGPRLWGSIGKSAFNVDHDDVSKSSNTHTAGIGAMGTGAVIASQGMAQNKIGRMIMRNSYDIGGHLNPMTLRGIGYDVKEMGHRRMAIGAGLAAGGLSLASVRNRVKKSAFGIEHSDDINKSDTYAPGATNKQKTGMTGGEWAAGLGGSALAADGLLAMGKGRKLASGKFGTFANKVGKTTIKRGALVAGAGIAAAGAAQAHAFNRRKAEGVIVKKSAFGVEHEVEKSFMSSANKVRNTIGAAKTGFKAGMGGYKPAAAGSKSIAVGASAGRSAAAGMGKLKALPTSSKIAGGIGAAGAVGAAGYGLNHKKNY